MINKELQHTYHEYLNISRIKGNQTKKFGRLKEHPKKIFFFFFPENEAGKLVPGRFLLF